MCSSLLQLCLTLFSFDEIFLQASAETFLSSTFSPLFPLKSLPPRKSLISIAYAACCFCCCFFSCTTLCVWLLQPEDVRSTIVKHKLTQCTSFEPLGAEHVCLHSKAESLVSHESLTDIFPCEPAKRDLTQRQERRERDCWLGFQNWNRENIASSACCCCCILLPQLFNRPIKKRSLDSQLPVCAYMWVVMKSMYHVSDAFVVFVSYSSLKFTRRDSLHAWSTLFPLLPAVTSHIQHVVVLWGKTMSLLVPITRSDAENANPGISLSPSLWPELLYIYVWCVRTTRSEALCFLVTIGCCNDWLQLRSLWRHLPSSLSSSSFFVFSPSLSLASDSRKWMFFCVRAIILLDSSCTFSAPSLFPRLSISFARDKTNCCNRCSFSLSLPNVSLSPNAILISIREEETERERREKNSVRSTSSLPPPFSEHYCSALFLSSTHCLLVISFSCRCQGNCTSSSSRNSRNIERVVLTHVSPCPFYLSTGSQIHTHTLSLYRRCVTITTPFPPFLSRSCIFDPLVLSSALFFRPLNYCRRRRLVHQL